MHAQNVCSCPYILFFHKEAAANCKMNKHPKEMDSEELFIKMEEDGMNSKAANIIRGKTIVGFKVATQ